MWNSFFWIQKVLRLPRHSLPSSHPLFSTSCEVFHLSEIGSAESFTIVCLVGVLYFKTAPKSRPASYAMWIFILSSRQERLKFLFKFYFPLFLFLFFFSPVPGWPQLIIHQLWMALNLWFSCFYHLYVGITAMCHHTWLLCVVVQTQKTHYQWSYSLGPWNFQIIV